MRNLLPLLLAPLLVACSAVPQSTPAPSGTPSGTPTLSATVEGDFASVTVTVFQDQNGNGLRDPGEPGVADQVGLAPDTNCTTGDPAVILPAETDPASGEAVYADLAPAEYCVMYRGDQPLTTEPAVTLTLSRGEHGEVAFGLQP